MAMKNGSFPDSLRRSFGLILSDIAESPTQLYKDSNKKKEAVRRGSDDTECSELSPAPVQSV